MHLPSKEKLKEIKEYNLNPYDLSAHHLLVSKLSKISDQILLAAEKGFNYIRIPVNEPLIEDIILAIKKEEGYSIQREYAKLGLICRDVSIVSGETCLGYLVMWSMK